jgi:mono/diheme cytochrome c family protein
MTARTLRRVLTGLLVSLVVAACGLWWNERDEPSTTPDSATSVATPQQIERGAYLARAGNCAGCHTARGGKPFAGGVAIGTPFGTVFSSNLTQDDTYGLGLWSAADFWRALHHGRSRDGRLLYPAFPYTSYTLVSREDSDAMFAYFKSIPGVSMPNLAHALDVPYRSQAALAVWRALFFRPGTYTATAGKSAEWNRGAYLVQGLGHCAECHAQRNALGARKEPLLLKGGMVPLQRWYAPSLAAVHEAGVTQADFEQTLALLKTGVAANRSAMGPMAEVVYRSTQYLSDPDLKAMVEYLKDQSNPSNPPPAPVSVERSAQYSSGEQIYSRHCADCHGVRGEGAPGAYAPLAGNRTVVLSSTANLVQAVLNGGYPPSTAGNPRPYGMPPFRQSLDDTQVAAVLTYIRQAWGHTAAAVSVRDVMQPK